MEDMEVIIFEIICNAGTAKGCVYEALQLAQEGQFDKADELLGEADEYLLKAHQIQTELIQDEAAGKHHEVSVLFVHAQDHLMTTIEVRSLAESLIEMNRRLCALEAKNNG